MGYVLLALFIITLGIVFIPWFKGHRTQIYTFMVSFIGAILPLAAEITEYLKGLDWSQYVSVQHAPWFVLVFTVGFLILRYKTTTPVGVK